MRFDPNEAESWLSWFPKEDGGLFVELDLWYLLAIARCLRAAPAISGAGWSFLENGAEGSSWEDRIKQITRGRDLKELAGTIDHPILRNTLKGVRGSLGGWLSFPAALELSRALRDDPPVPSPAAEEKYNEVLEEFRGYARSDSLRQHLTKHQLKQVEEALNFKDAFNLALDEAKLMLAAATERRTALRIVLDP